MRLVRLAGETDFSGWREGARALRGQGVPPEQVVWAVGGEGDLFAEPEVEATAPPGARSLDTGKAGAAAA